MPSSARAPAAPAAPRRRGPTRAACLTRLPRLPRSAPSGSALPPALNAIGMTHRSVVSRCGYVVDCLIDHRAILKEKEAKEKAAKEKAAAAADDDQGKGGDGTPAGTDGGDAKATEKEAPHPGTANAEAAAVANGGEGGFEATALLYLRESDYISGRHELRAPLQLKLRQLDAVGASPAQSPPPLRATPISPPRVRAGRRLGGGARAVL